MRLQFATLAALAGVVPMAQGGEIRLSWDRHQWRVPHTVPDGGR
jgi:hypothetical protein